MGGPWRRVLAGFCLCQAALLPELAFGSELERNNWVVLVDTSRYWYNYRHVANVLSFYHTIKRLGIPDSQIILMMAEEIPCNPRNSKPGMVFKDSHEGVNLYGEDVEVDYRGDEVSIENFLRLLTGRHTPDTPRNKRLLTDSMSNVMVFVTGHSGEEFIKFQDWEEITSTDIADAFEHMHKQRRYRHLFWVSDTCQAASLQNQFYSPNIIGFGSSGKKESSYSHHIDHKLGIAVIDRFTYYALDLFNQLTPTSQTSLADFENFFDPRALAATPEMRSDLFPKKPSETKLTEFFAATGKMRFQNKFLSLHSSSNSSGLSCATAAGLPATVEEAAAPPPPNQPPMAEAGLWNVLRAYGELARSQLFGRQRKTSFASGASPRRGGEGGLQVDDDLGFAGGSPLLWLGGFAAVSLLTGATL